jgi:hypothetical protein
MKIVKSNKKRSKPTVDRVAELERELANQTLAIRVSQALLKQLMEQLRPMQDDLTRFYGALNDLQYKTSALIDAVPDADRTQLAAAADALKLADWQTTSDKDDVARGLVPADVVTADTDVVIITSTTPDEIEDKGIFRSKIVLRDIANKDIVDGLLHKPIGTTLETQINGSRHIVELVGVRVATKSTETSSEA